MPKPPKLTFSPDIDTSLVEDQNFRKANAEIGFRIKKGRMTFLSRKVLNSLTYRAQMMGLEGKGLSSSRFGKLVIPEDLKHENYWWLDLSEVVRDASFNSKDYSLLKEYLEDLQRVLVIRDLPGSYGSDQLLGSVRIINSQGPGRKRGGKLLLGWQFPEETESKILKPDMYTRLSVYFQGLLRTEQALVLYEICKRFSTNPANLTARKHWNLWFEQLTGNEIGDKKPEYKYFKRNLLVPAIKEVNTVTDIEIELLEFKKGRWVEDLQFTTKPKAQQQLILPEEPAIDGALLERLESIGIRDAERICASHTHDFVRATLDVVAERMKNPKLQPLENPAAFFRVALRDEYAKVQKTKRLMAIPRTVEPVVTEDAEAARLRQQNRERFEGLPKEEQESVIEAFLEAANPIAKSNYLKSGLRARLAKSEFDRLLPSLLDARKK